MSPPPQDAAAVASTDDHDRWFVEQVHTHDASLKAYLRGSFPDIRDVEDVVQESYLRVWRRQSLRPIESVRGFLFKVARHLALDTLKHERRSPASAVADISALGVAEERPAIAEEACVSEEVELLLATIDQLPGRCRAIYIMRKLHGVSQRVIAQRLGITEETVEVQIGRANRRCEKFLRWRGVINRGRA